MNRTIKIFGILIALFIQQTGISQSIDPHYEVDNLSYIPFEAIPDNGNVLISKVEEIQLQTPPFKRGVNLAGWFENFDSIYTIQFKLYTREDFENIKSLGCDNIRLPLEFFDMTGPAPDYILNPLLFRLLDQIVDWAEELNLHLILDNHSFDPFIETEPEIKDQLLAVWSQVADHYKYRSNLIYYEILNEPHGIADNVWNDIQQHAIDAIRAQDQTHTIIVGPANWNNFNNLKLMPQFTDDNLIYTFHFYDPHIFTHQGTTWEKPSLENLVGVPYPYDAGSMPDLPANLIGTWVEGSYNAYPEQGTDAWVHSQIDIAVQFMNERRVPVWCGEFGAHNHGSRPEDRARWLESVRTYLESNGISWAHHEYSHDFGIFEPGSHNLFEHNISVPIIEALGLSIPPQSPYLFLPDSTDLIIYDDYISQRIFNRGWLASGSVNFYSQSNPAEGDFCILWQGANQYDALWFRFDPIHDLTQLVENDNLVDMWIRGNTENVKIDIRFEDTDTDDPDDHPWRMRYTIDNTVVNWDGTWQHLQIPLAVFTEQGAFDDNTWYNSQGDFDWSQVEYFVIDPAYHDLNNVELYFDNISVVSSLAPIAEFFAVPIRGTAPQTVQFTNQSIGNITSYLWDFGDGATSTEKNPSHTYLDPDTLTVKLTVTGPGGSGNKTRYNYITVAPGWENILLNGDFSDGTNHWMIWIDPSASASSDVQNGEYVVSLANGGSYSYNVQLFQVGLFIENGKTYNVSFDAYADTSRQIIPYVAMSNSPWTTYGGYQIVTLSNTKQTFTYSFTMNHPTDPDARIVLDVGNSNVDVYIDNIVLVKTTAIPVAEFSAFPVSGTAPLSVQFTDQSSGDITSYLWDFGDGATSTETNPSHTYLYPDILTVKLIVNGPGGSNTKISNNYITISPNPENILLNGDFSDDDNHWDLFVDASASASSSVVNGEYAISINNGGLNTWDVHLQQSELLLEKGITYHISFEGYAESIRQINVFTAMILEPWTIYGYQPVKLNTTKQTHTFSFTMNEATNKNARLAFDVGSSTTDVYLDNIVLKEVITSVKELSNENKIPDSFILYQNYPNPFNPITTIVYGIPEDASVVLKIYNVLGSEVMNFAEGHKTTGYHKVSFDASDLPSGIYFYRLQAGSFIETKKMILMK